MSDSGSSSASSGGIGFFGLLGIVFIVMKLMGWGVVAGWSWWWVTSPLWLPFCVVFGIILAVLAVVAIFGGIVALFK